MVTTHVTNSPPFLGTNGGVRQKRKKVCADGRTDDCDPKYDLQIGRHRQCAFYTSREPGHVTRLPRGPPGMKKNTSLSTSDRTYAEKIKDRCKINKEIWSTGSVPTHNSSHNTWNTKILYHRRNTVLRFYKFSTMTYGNYIFMYFEV